MAALTDTQLLTATREAIDALTAKGAAAYTINGRSYTALDLNTLWAQVNRLERRLAQTNGKGRSAVARPDRVMP